MDANLSFWKKAVNLTDALAKANILPNGSLTPRPVIIASIQQEQETTPKTSKYQRILETFSKKAGLNVTINATLQRGRGNETFLEENSTEQSNKSLALILPLVLLAIFLTLVIIFHRFDTVRTRRSRNKQAGKTWKTSEVEPAVEEIPREANVIPVQLRRVNWLLNKRQKDLLDNYGKNCQNRCICKLARCSHCMGYEQKKIQWKDLVERTELQNTKNLFQCKNASTQTWMPLVYRMKKVPQSSQRDSNTRLPSSIRPYFVEPDSVFDSEVSSKPHFPSSASNYAESIKEVSGSFYYSAASGHSTSVFQETNRTKQLGEKGSRNNPSRTKGIRKNYRSEAQLISTDEDWL